MACMGPRLPCWQGWRAEEAGVLAPRWEALGWRPPTHGVYGCFATDPVWLAKFSWVTWESAGGYQKKLTGSKNISICFFPRQCQDPKCCLCMTILINFPMWCQGHPLVAPFKKPNPAFWVSGVIVPALGALPWLGCPPRQAVPSLWVPQTQCTSGAHLLPLPVRVPPLWIPWAQEGLTDSLASGDPQGTETLSFCPCPHHWLRIYETQ